VPRRPSLRRGLRQMPRLKDSVSSAVEARQLELAAGRARPIYSGFLHWAEHAPTHPAMDVEGETWTYAQLRGRAAALAATIQRKSPVGGAPLTAVFAYRSSTAFAGVIGSLMSGHGYVPLNRTFPPDRTRVMLRSADCRSVVVDAQSEEQLDSILQGIETSLLVILPDRSDVSELARRWPCHAFVGANGLEPPEGWVRRDVSPDAVAYLLFTSGSTGVPKGVMVAHRNVVHFVETMVERYGVRSDDRFSQMFDMTFDLSVFDMFVAWEAGACVCCPSGKVLLNPDRFIRDKQLTIWGSVPSVAVFMNRFGVLKPGRYPSLRWSWFCGEPLPVPVARNWAAAAPCSVVENLYGPTELTVACSAYRWTGERSVKDAQLGVVPIGSPYPDMHAIVVDDELREVPPGESGELLMSGPQVTLGYWRNEAATRRAYVTPPGRDTVFYRTGDRVRRPIGHEPMTYVGRVDHQIKVLGHRVELGEVEALLREEPGVDAAVAVGWPVSETGAGAIVAFVTGTAVDPAALRARAKSRLQPYAVPQAVHVLPSLPQTSNGKVDRKALVAILDRFQS